MTLFPASSSESLVCSSAGQIDGFRIALVRQRVAIADFFDHEGLAPECRERFIVTVESASNGLNVVTQELVAVHLRFPQMRGDDESARWLEDSVDLGQCSSKRRSWKIVDGVEGGDT